jgi:hypothetical protein
MDSCTTSQQVVFASNYNVLLINHWYKKEKKKVGSSSRLFNVKMELLEWVNNEKYNKLMAL